jgi:hypothetical protein
MILPVAGATRADGRVMRRGIGFLWRVLLVVVLATAVIASLLFTLRTYRSWQFLRSAQEIGAADTASVRPWMTVEYIARTYGVPESALAERLGVPAEASARTSLRQLAGQRGQSPVELVQEAQRAIAELRQTGRPPPALSEALPSTG